MNIIEDDQVTEKLSTTGSDPASCEGLAATLGEEPPECR